MKKYLLLFLLTFTGLYTYSQDYLTLGNNCYEEGDYDCARDNYQKYLNLAPNDQNIITLRQKAGECAIYKIAADKAFSDRDIKEAKTNYEAIININPHDAYAKERIKQCNKILNPIINLSVSSEDILFDSDGGSQSISVTTNADNYTISLLPTWCSVSKGSENFTISCNSTPTARSGYFKVIADDKEIRIDVKQVGIETTLSVSTRNLSFDYTGGRTSITVSTNSDSYDVTVLPAWCTVTKYENDFSIYCNPNSSSERKDWFKVKAGDKEIRIDVVQATDPRYNTTAYKSTKNKKTSTKSHGCFNCPTAKYPWGITVGYVDEYLKYFDYDFGDYYTYMEIKGIQAGLKFEPLFKYGFGLNTGIFYEYTSTSFDDVYTDSYDYEQHLLNLPFHLEYRFNFSRYFNIFGFFGPAFEYVIRSPYDEDGFRTSVEYGGGLRIDHVQLNIGKSYYLRDISEFATFNPSDEYKKLIFSISYMF